MNQETTTEVSQQMERRNKLNSIIDTIPSLKSLLLLRRLQLLNKTDGIADVVPSSLATKSREELDSLVKKSIFRTQLEEIAQNATDVRDSIRKRVYECYGDVKKYIEVIDTLKNESPITLYIDSHELSSIPYPTPIQIEKDITRESLIINGVSIEGSQGLKQIRSTLLSILPQQSDSILDSILQRMCRTRIGEYCYSELMKLLPLEEGTLLIIVDNVDNKPIEMQMTSKLFETNHELAWGVCTSLSFDFSYSIISLNDVSNQKERVAKINIRCQYWMCFGLEDFEGHNVDDTGFIEISVE